MLALLGHLLVRLSEVQDKSSKLSRRRIMPNALIAGKPRGGGAWDGKNVDVFHNGLSSPTESCLRSAMYFKWTPQSFRTVLKRPESTVLVLKALCSSFQHSSRCFEMHDEKCHHTLSIPAWEARRETEGNYIMGCNIGKWDDCSTLVAFVSFVCWRCVRVSVEMNWSSFLFYFSCTTCLQRRRLCNGVPCVCWLLQ